MKPGTAAGAMPVNVSVNARPIVTAGLAKEAEEVNQHAAPIGTDRRRGDHGPAGAGEREDQ